MKIAVQFFGHLRTFEKCVESVRRHLLLKYDCDVFMHTWSLTDHKTKTWYRVQDKNITVVDNYIKKRIFDLYSPKALLIEDQNFLSDDEFFIPCMHNNGETKISSLGLKYMIHSKYRVNELRIKYQIAHNVNYDYVVMIRPDVMLYEDLDLNSVIDEINISGYVLSRFCAFNYINSRQFPVLGNCASDVLYFGSPMSIDRVVSVLNRIDFLSLKNGIWNPESLFVNELLKKGVASQLINFECNKSWEILRNKNFFSKNQFISLRIRTNKLCLKILNLLPFNLFFIKFVFFNYYRIVVSVGRCNGN